MELSAEDFSAPSGRATRAIITEYDLPARTRQPHDVIVDSDGMVWYISFGEQILGRLDPKTGKTTEFPIPILKPQSPTGELALRPGPGRKSLDWHDVPGRLRKI